MKFKKAYISLKTVLLIAIIVLIVMFYKGNLETGSIFSSFTSQTTTTTEKEVVHDTQVLNADVDLCSLFQPYVVAGDTVNQCNILGGTWGCRDDFVGCSNTVVPSIDCSGTVIQTAMYQCQSAGGEYTCNTNNAYCLI